MKRILCTIALILALVCVVASCNKSPEITISEDGYWVINGEKTDVKAQGEKGDKGDKGDSATATDENPLGLAFFLKDDGTYIVEIGNAKYLSKIEIPATYNGKAVTEVGDFSSNKVKEIIIDRGIKSIGDDAFFWCTSLTSVAIPDSVTSIGDSAFADCTSLTSVTIPDSVTSIGEYAFAGCTSLMSITIPDSFTSIGNGTFSGCTSLTSVIIPDGIVSIADNAFGNCNNLVGNLYDNAYYLGNDQNPYLLLLCAKSTDITSCIIHKDTRFFHESAFSDCTFLTSVTILDSVTSIGSGAFAYCTSLTSILVDNDNTAYQSIEGNLYSKDGNTLIAYAIGKTAMSFTIPDGVTSIGDEAFYGCEALMSVTIPDSVTSIGYQAFRGCYALTSATFENPNGWWIASNAAGINGEQLDYLSDSSMAAQHLSRNYVYEYWFRTE